MLETDLPKWKSALRMDFSSFISQNFDPVKHFKSIKVQFYFKSHGRRLGIRQHALIAALKLSRCYRPADIDHVMKEPHVQHDKTIFEFDNLNTSRSIYFSNGNDNLPIVLDSGASLSITPNRNDFIQDLSVSDVSELKGLSHTEHVVGKGVVEWTIRDVFGTVRTIRTTAYYVPAASIRLFSPQQYFSETSSGSLLLTHRHANFVLHDGTDLEFPYNAGSNLQLMLPAIPSIVGLIFKDCKALSSTTAISTLLSVSDETNENLSLSQKELLHWHWRLWHANFQWIQRLLAKRTESETRGPILPSKSPKSSSCKVPLCAACQFAKQACRGSGTSIESQLPDKSMRICQNQLLTGAKVSIDQYISTVPGRLAHTKGKELKREKYVGGTIFVDHCSSYIHASNQVTLRAGDTVRAKQTFENFATSCGV